MISKKTILPFAEREEDREKWIASVMEVITKNLTTEPSDLLSVLDIEFPEIDDEIKRTVLSKLYRQRISNGDLVRLRKAPMQRHTVFDRINCLTVDTSPGGPFVVITCDKCGTTDKTRFTKLGESPTLFLSKWRRERWKIKGDGRKAVCPSCQERTGSHEIPIGAPVSQPATLPVSAPPTNLEIPPAPSPLPPIEENQSEMSEKASRIFDEAFKRSAVRKISALSGSERISMMGTLGVGKTSYYEWAKEFPEEIRTSDIPTPIEKAVPGERRTFTDEQKRAIVRKIMSLPRVGRTEAIRAEGVDVSAFYRWEKQYGEGKTERKTKEEPPVTLDVADQFKLFLLLQENFDTEKHSYKNGYSDARCAQELGVPESAIATIREKTVGPIVDAEHEAVRKQIDALTVKFDQNYQAILEMAAGMKSEYEAEIEKLWEKLS